MKNNRMQIVILILMVLLVGVGCQPAQQESNKRVVYTSIYPLYEVANRISSEDLVIKLVVPNGAELHSYRPTPKRIAALENSDLFIYNGLGLEPWAKKAVANLKQQDTKIVNISEYVNLIEFKKSEHSHEKEGHKEHSHNNYDPHLWLNPNNMKLIAQQLKNEFKQLTPTNKEKYQQNYQKFSKRIDQLDQKYRNLLANKKQNQILVSHSAFGYLADQYGFKQLSVTGIAPHEEPSPGVLAELTNKAEKYNLKYIFMEKLANPKTVEILAQEADLKILELNPVAGLTKKEGKSGANYFTIMEENLKNLEKALVK